MDGTNSMQNMMMKCQWELTEKDWECLTGVVISGVWGWLTGDEGNGLGLFFGGRGGPLILELGTW